MSDLLEASSLYTEKNLGEFEEKFGLHFIDKALLVTALSHRSPLGFSLTSKDEMRRLALMGDKIIDLLLFRVLYDRKTTLKDMNDARRYTENTELDKIADRLGFEKYLFLEDSVDEKIREKSVSFGSDSLEAVVGAIFIDSGFNTTQQFVDKWIIHNILPD
jgi:ribonuclease-3